MKGECGEAERDGKEEGFRKLHEESVRAGTFGVPANLLPAQLLRRMGDRSQWVGFAQFNCAQV
jgi:reverse gyrase